METRQAATTKEEISAIGLGWEPMTSLAFGLVEAKGLLVHSKEVRSDTVVGRNGLRLTL